MIKRFVGLLPLRYQQELKRLHCARLIRKGWFKTAEDKELERLHLWVRAGDWVLDIGANIGTYTARLSELVDVTGRVLAFEPVPENFELLSANMARFELRNITLVNAAVSDQFSVCGMTTPKLDNGLDNRYMSHLTKGAAELAVLCMPIDRLDIPHPVSLAKIDVEGHELQALKGMRHILERDHPVLIVEGRSADVASYLRTFGYSFEEATGSPNRVFSVGRLPEGSQETVA